jgi:hypothetical protein
MARREKESYVIQSVTNALNLLEEFKGDRDELGVTVLSKRLNLHKNNIFRLLATLEAKAAWFGPPGQTVPEGNR